MDGGGAMKDLLKKIDDLMKKYPVHHYDRAARIMKELRNIKTKEEIDVTNKAINITANKR